MIGHTATPTGIHPRMTRLARLVAASVVLTAASATAQTVDDQAARNSANWEIFEKLYPRRALAAHEEGAVGFTVDLDSKGEVTRCKVTHSSGYPLLDEETCQLVTLHAQFKADPAISGSQTRSHQGLIAWKLPESLKMLEPPKPVAAAQAPEQVVCKKTVRAGTLAGFERTCMTPTQWARQTDDMKQPYEEMQGRKGSSSGVSCISPSGC